MQIRMFPLSAWQANCYLLSRDGEAVLVDPGEYDQGIVDIIENENLKVTHILITHIHLDHFYGATRFAELTGAKIYIHPKDDYLIPIEVVTWEECMYPESCGLVDYVPFEVGVYEFLGERCDVMLTPGHTPGSVTLYFSALKIALSGDVIFAGSVGRTDLNGGEPEVLPRTIHEVLFKLPGDTQLLSGHGQPTTVEHEMKYNPCV